MNVLSLFDGMSCGRLALERAGHEIANYFASEVDKFAIKVAAGNYPDTKHLGDVTRVRASDLPEIDLLIGGSPCQGFSFAGKQLNFEDERSKLFFEFVRLLEECKPRYFLLENVRMKKEYQDVISKLLGVEPIEINSALVSAQNRRRLYWTNIEGVEQPEDRGIFVADILEGEVEEKYYMSPSWRKWWAKNKEFQLKKKYSSLDAEKAICMTARQYADWSGNFLSDPRGVRRYTPIECERLQTVPDNFTNFVSDTQRYKMLGNGWTVDAVTHIFKNMPDFLAW